MLHRRCPRHEAFCTVVSHHVSVGLLLDCILDYLSCCQQERQAYSWCVYRGAACVGVDLIELLIIQTLRKTPIANTQWQPLLLPFTRL